MPKLRLSGGKQYQWAFWGLLTLLTVIRLCYIQWGPLDLAPVASRARWRRPWHSDLKFRREV